jgi:hypothetical protein
MAIGKCRECGAEVSDQAKVCPKCGVSKPIKKTSIIVKLLGALFLIALLQNIFLQSTPSTSSTNSPSIAETPKLTPKEEAMQSVKLENWTWHTGGFDTVMMLNAKIVNKGSRDVKDIEIQCTHFAGSDTVIDKSKKIVYELLKAGKSVSIKDFSMGFVHSQAKSTSCRITDLVLM